MAGRIAYMPSMAHPVRRRGGASIAMVSDLTPGHETKQPATGRIEGALHRFRLAVGEQRPALLVDEVENDLFDWPTSEVVVHLQSADDLTAERPDVVAVLAQGVAR